MRGFLQSVAMAGARPVPSRMGINLRRAGGKPAVAAPIDGAPRRAVEPHPEPAAPDRSAGATGMEAPVTLPVPARAEVRTERDPVQPIATAPSIAAPPTPLPPAIEPRPAIERRTAPPESPRRGPDPVEAVAEIRQADSPTPPAPLPRVPVLSGETWRAEPAVQEEFEPPLRVDAGVARFSRPPVLEGEDSVGRVTISGFAPPPIQPGKPMPLPSLDVPDRAPVAPAGLETPAPPRGEAVPRQSEPPPPRTAVVQPVLNPASAAAWRAPAPRPSGLTIHKLEVQIVERPRDLPPEPAPAAAAAVEHEASPWPDRRYQSRVW